MKEQPEDFMEMVVPAKPEYVGVVRLTASGVANRMGYSFDDIEDIKVAVSEACTNVVNHAYQNGENGKITIGFAIYEKRLEIMVADRGQSFDVGQIRQKGKPFDKDVAIEKMNEGGLGLFLIETLMDKVEIRSDSGVVVLMTKFLQGGEVRQSADAVSSKQQPS